MAKKSHGKTITIRVSDDVFGELEEYLKKDPDKSRSKQIECILKFWLEAQAEVAEARRGMGVAISN